MIYVEATIINLKTQKIGGKYYKSFDMIADFNSWYDLTKNNGDVIINVMKYNPMDKPSQKNIYDTKLLSLGRGTVT